jgi:predicted AAA+ superfamily ATPase
MKQLFSIFYRYLENLSGDFERYLINDINWNNRLIALTGARGCGKTTLLLQYIKKKYGAHPENVLYVSLDNIWFTTNRLYDLATNFSLMGGSILFLDEVHKYDNWSREIKNIYDEFSNLKIVFTSSSMLEIFRSDADLSRRVRHYMLYGMSFREYLIYEGLLDKEQKSYSLAEILKNHVSIAGDICRKIKPVPIFKKYLQHGYYPYYKEDKGGYPERILQTFNTIIETDLINIEKVEVQSINKIKKLFAIVASLVPFTPNISKLSQSLETTRISLLNYLYYLEKAHAIMLLHKDVTEMRQLVKPEKVYLQNTNYAYALSPDNADIGNQRETFFFNQLQVKHKLTYTKNADFLVDEKISFEIGGRSKSQQQIYGLSNAYLVSDDIEIGFKNDIPLWLFGFLY